MPSVELHIDEQWKDALASVGLDSADAMMNSTQGKCFSNHTRGQTYRIELDAPDGLGAVFLKRDMYTSSKDILTDLCSFRYPQPPCLVECRALKLVAELGIPAPRPIAWGQRRRFALPHQGVLVMTPLGGESIAEFLSAAPPQEDRIAKMHDVGQIAKLLYEAGLSWPDLRPKHFILAEKGMGVLDLARMRPTKRPRRCYMPKQVGRFLKALTDCGGNAADRNAFLYAIACDGILAGIRK